MAARGCGNHLDGNQVVDSRPDRLSILAVDSFSHRPNNLAEGNFPGPLSNQGVDNCLDRSPAREQSLLLALEIQH